MEFSHTRASRVRQVALLTHTHRETDIETTSASDRETSTSLRDANHHSRERNDSRSALSALSAIPRNTLALSLALSALSALSAIPPTLRLSSAGTRRAPPTRPPGEEVEPLGALERPLAALEQRLRVPLERREPATDVHERPEPRRGRRDRLDGARGRGRVLPSTLRRPSTSTVSFLPPAAGVAPASPLSDPRLDFFHPSDPSTSRRATPRSTPRASARRVLSSADRR